MTTNTPLVPPALPPRPQTREEFEAEQTANTRINTGTSGANFASLTQQGGVQTLTVGKNGTEFTPVVDPSFVQVQGMSIKREVYHTLLQSGTLPPGAKIVDHAPHLSKEHTLPFDNGSGADDPVADNSEKTEANPATNPAAEAVFREGEKAIEAAVSAIGEAAVQEAIQNAAISGDLTPPPGTSPSQSAAVLAGYMASAQEMIADAGISVGDMSIALSEDELRDARLSVVQGNVPRMQELAGKAVDALASMPVRDPASFEWFIDQRFPDLDWKTDEASGRALVHVEGRGYIPWDTIVRSSWLHKAKAVPRQEDDGE